MRRIGLAIAALALAGFFTGQAWAGHKASHLAADKVAISSSALVIKLLADDDGTDPGAVEVTLLGPIKYKVSTPTDIKATFHTECLLLTKTKAKGSGGKTGTSAAKLEVGIEIAPVEADGNPGAWQPVPISGNDDGNNADVDEFVDFIGVDPGVGRVFMCSRWQQVSFDFTNLVIENDDFIQVWTETRQAHGFEWAIVNPAATIGSNTFFIRVQGRLDATATAGSEAAVAAAKRLLSLDPVKIFQVITDTNTGCFGDGC